MNADNLDNLLNLFNRWLPLAALDCTDIALAGAQPFLGEILQISQILDHQTKRFIEFHLLSRKRNDEAFLASLGLCYI